MNKNNLTFKEMLTTFLSGFCFGVLLIVLYSVIKNLWLKH